MFPPDASGNKYRDPQQYIIQSVRDLGTLTHKWDVSIKSLPSQFSVPLGRRGRNSLTAKGYREHQENTTF